MAMKLEQSDEPGNRYCSQCKKVFFSYPINKEHCGHKTYDIMALGVEQSTKPGFRYCLTCKTDFFHYPVNEDHQGHKTYALGVEQSTEPGYRYCSTCDNNFRHPINDEHQDHKTYETRQCLFLDLKYQLLQATQEIEDILKKLTVQEHTAHNSITRPLQTLKQETETSIEQHETVPQFHRIASWNLKKLSDNTKTSLILYEQRLHSICKTILYYQFDIVALQEVCTETTAKFLVRMLNENSDLNWDKKLIQTNREFPTILYNEYITDAWKNTRLKEMIAELKYQKAPFSCTFEIPTRSTSKKIVLISTHITCADEDKKTTELKKLPHLLLLHDSMSHDSMSHDSMPHDSTSHDSTSHDSTSLDSMSHDSMSHVILLGDFNTGPDKLDDAIKSTSHKCVLPEGTKTNTAGTRSYDNILVSSKDKKLIKDWSVGSIITCKGLRALDFLITFPYL